MPGEAAILSSVQAERNDVRRETLDGLLPDWELRSLVSERFDHRMTAGQLFDWQLEVAVLEFEVLQHASLGDP
jgi:hypothetical protein